jgi:hypothetical protein
MAETPFEGVPAAFEHASDAAEFKRPPHRPGVELYRAHIVRRTFEPHAHEGYGLGAIESGVERFRYRGGDHLAPPDSLMLMNADELHTGRAARTAHRPAAAATVEGARAGGRRHARSRRAEAHAGTTGRRGRPEPLPLPAPLQGRLPRHSRC